MTALEHKVREYWYCMHVVAKVVISNDWQELCVCPEIVGVCTQWVAQYVKVTSRG